MTIYHVFLWSVRGPGTSGRSSLNALGLAEHGQHPIQPGGLAERMTCLDVPGRELGSMVSKWVINVYNLLINGIYWGYNPLTNLLLTSWDIQVFADHI